MSNTAITETKANACVYILHMLLQRLEAEKPGLVADMLSGARADNEAFSAQKNQQEDIAQTFSEAISILELIHQQKQA